MSSSQEELLEHAESEAPNAADSEGDAHVGDDVCVAVVSAARSGRRRWWDASWVTAISVSLLCHLSLAAVWWEWHVQYELPDFAIRSGVGGTVGTGSTNDASAAPPAMTQLPAGPVNDPLPMSNTEPSPIDDEPLSPALAGGGTHSSLVEAMHKPNDLIAMRSSGWSPDVVPSRGSARGTATQQDAPIGDATRIAPLDSGSGGGGDGLAIVGLSQRAANDPPIYPEMARRQRQQGTVWLKLLVGADGRVREVTIQQSSGFPLLDEEAVRKFSSYVVSPYHENGVAMDLHLTDVPVVFRLK